MNNKITSTCLAFVAFTAMAVAADTPPDGNYTYNTTTGGGNNATVYGSGYTLEITTNGSTKAFEKQADGSYQSSIHSPPAETITFTDEGYRFSGVSSITGVCTLYKSKANPGPGW